MKRYRYYTAIEGMSVSKDEMITKMKNRAPKLAEHLAECAMYGDGLGRSKYNHWVDHEIATWLSDINKLPSKPKNKKLKPNDYAFYLFDPLGDEWSDAEVALHDLQLYNSSKSNSYPFVEVDESMIRRMFDITQIMLTKIVPILASPNSLTKKDIEGILHTLLDPICTGVEIW